MRNVVLRLAGCALQCGSTRLDNVALSARKTTKIMAVITAMTTRYDDKDWRGGEGDDERN
jgi:hypothetical protein